jgi:hypothetical protein
MTAWLSETKDFAGCWNVQIKRGDKPVVNRADGPRGAFKYPPVEIPACLQDFTITTIARAVLPDGDLHFMAPETLAAHINNHGEKELRIQVGSRR